MSVLEPRWRAIRTVVGVFVSLSQMTVTDRSGRGREGGDRVWLLEVRRRMDGEEFEGEAALVMVGKFKMKEFGVVMVEGD